jgi:hypothetical protein
MEKDKYGWPALTKSPFSSSTHRSFRSWNSV